MTDPDDKTLLEFTARFCGWREVMFYGGRPELCGRHDDYEEVEQIPDYLHSVDAWLSDVWPKVKDSGIMHRVASFVLHKSGYDGRGQLNFVEVGLDADARSRCLALYRALDGTLPQPEPKAET